MTEGRERRYSQDSESSGGAPSAEVTDDESENEDGSTRKDVRTGQKEKECATSVRVTPFTRIIRL